MGIADDIERALATDHRARERAREEIFVLFRDLSWEDQFKVYEFVQGHFVPSPSASKAFDEAQRRAECVAAIKRVVAHLGLPEGSSLGFREYDKVRGELGMPLSSAAIIRCWGSWAEAGKAARGERVSMTPLQRAHFRAALKRRPSGHGEWLAGVREWLEEGGPSQAEVDYNAWAQKRFEERPGLPLASRASCVRVALGLQWTLVLKVARGDVSLADAQAQRLRTLVREGRGFAGLNIIALLHGLSMHRAIHMSEDPKFPAVAFKLGTCRIWHLSDIKAHRAGRRFPAREPGGLQGEVMDSVQVRALLGLSAKAMNIALGNQLRWNRSPSIPPPHGCVARRHFWWASDVEEWARGRGLGEPG